MTAKTAHKGETSPKKRGRPKKVTAGKIKIDKEFQSLILPQTKAEQAQLEQNLLAEGRCRDRLVLWKGPGILLDGHHRLDVCKKHNLPFDTVEIELKDRDAARAWIRDNQLGRRNLTPEAVAYLRGQHYNGEKQSHGGDRKSETSSGNDDHLNTADALAERYKVGAKTIRNDGDFAAALDKITENGDDKLKTALLRREVTLTRKQLQELADMEDQEKQQEAVTEVLETGKMPKRKAGKKSTKAGKEKITVPTDPVELVKALLRDLGPSVVEKVQKAITQALAEHKAKQQPSDEEE
jgi:hypothetical protein